MDLEKMGEVTQIGIANLQQSGDIQVEDMDKTCTEVIYMETSPRITTAFQSTADSDEDTILSEATFGITSEKITMYQASPKIIPKIYISTTLESNTDVWEEISDTVGQEESMASENNHISTPEMVCKPTTGDDISDSKEVILDASENTKCTASGNVYSEEYIISTSSGDSTISTIEETSSVLESTIIITTSGETFYKTPRNMTVNKTIVSTTPEISATSTITRGDLCNSFASGEAVPVTGDTNDITSEDVIRDAFNSFSVGDTTETATTLGSIVVSMGTNGTEEISNSEDWATKEGDSTIFPGGFTNCPSPVSDPEEISHHALNDMLLSGSETTTMFSDSGTDSLFSEDTSTITSTFSAAFQQAPTVVSGTTISSSSDSNNTAGESTESIEGPGNSPTNGNTEDAIIKEATAKAPTTTIASRKIGNVSPDGNLDASENRTSSVSLTVSGYTVTTDSGNFVILSNDENTTSSEIISTPCLDTATINENFLIGPGNVTNIISTRENTNSAPKGMDITSGNMPAIDIPEIFSKSSLSGKSISKLSSGEVRDTEVYKENVITVSDNSVIISNSIHSFECTNTTEYVATSGSGNSTVKEDDIATAPASTSETEQLSSPGKATNLISRDILNTPVEDTFQDTTTISSFTESVVDPIPMAVTTISTQGNVCLNMRGNVTASCRTTIVSEGVISITLDKSIPHRHKTTTNGFGDDVIPGNDTGIVCKDVNHSPFDVGIITTASGELFASFQNASVHGYVTTTASSQDTSGDAAETERGRSSETITGKISRTFGNYAITHGVTASTDVIHMIPTTVATIGGTREAPTENTIPILEDNNITATTEVTSASQKISSTTSEEDIITTTSGDVKSMASPETSTIHFENDFITASFIDFENTSVTSSAYRDTVPSAEEDTVNIASRNITTSASEEFPTTVSDKVPTDPYKITIHTERTIAKPRSKDSQIKDTSENSTEGKITVSINPSETDISTIEANNTTDSAHRRITTTAIDKQLTSQHPSLSHVIPPLEKESSLRGNYTLSETSTSAVTTRIQGDINHGGNTHPEELITAVPSLTSSAVTVAPTSISSRDQPALESTSPSGDNHNKTASSDTSSTHNTARDRNLSVASVDDDNNPPSDTTTVVSGGFLPNLEAAPNISLFSSTIDAVEDTQTNTVDSLIDTTGSAETSTDTSEKKQYEEGSSSAHSGTTTTLGHLNSSFSAESSVQEASTEPMAAFSYTTDTSEDAHIDETFVSVHNKITTTLEQESSFSKATSSGCTTIKTTTQNGRPLTEDISNHSESNNMWNDTSMTPVVVVGSKNEASHGDTKPLHEPITPGPNVISVTSRISEVICTPEDAKDNTVTGDIYVTEDTTIITPSVEMNVSLANASRELATVTSGEFAKTTTLLEDAVALAPVKEATSTVTTLKDAAVITQDFSEDNDTLSKHEFADILHDSPQVGETLSSENISAYTLGDAKMVTDSEALTSELMSSTEMYVPEDATDLVANIIPKGTLHNDPSMVTTDTSAASGTVSSLNDTVSIIDDATSVSELAMSSEEVLSSENDSTGSFVDISIQNQAPFTEASTIAPDKISFSTGETVTNIPTLEAEIITDNVIVAKSADGIVTDGANIPSSPENVTNIIVPCVSPTDADTAVSIPLDTHTSASVLPETGPLGETFSSGNTISVTTEDISAHPDSFVSTETFNTLVSTPHEHKGHPFTSSLDIVSTLEDTARIYEKSIAFGHSIPPNLFADETDLAIDVGEASPSRDITNIASDVSTMSGRMNTSESEGTNPTNAPDSIPITSEAIVLSSGDSTAEFSGAKCIVTDSLPSGDITATVPEDNIIDLNVPECINISTALGDIHTTPVIGFEDATNVIKNRTAKITNTQYATSTPSHTRPHGKTSASETTCVPKANVATRETCGTDFSKTLTKRGKTATSDLAKNLKGTNPVHTENLTSPPRDYIHISDSIPTPRGKVTAMIAIFEDVGKQNESSTSRATFSFAETPVRQVNFKSGMNFPYREVRSTSSAPNKFKEDAILTPVAASAVAITQASETVMSHSKTKSLGKSDLSRKSIISTADSVHGTVSCPREIVSSPSGVISGSSSENTLKGISTIGTPRGLPEADTSAVTTPFEETQVSDNTKAPVDSSTKVATVGTEEASTSNVNIVLEEYPPSEVKTVPEEIVSKGIISTPRDNFVYGATESSIDTLVPTDLGSLPDSVSQSTVFSAETTTHKTTVSSEEMDTSGNASSNKIVAVANVTSVATITSSISSSENVTFIPCSGTSPDGAHVSRKAITINSETIGLPTTAPKETVLFEDCATNASGYQNTPELSNIHEYATRAPENGFPAVPEDAAIDSGSRIIAPDDGVATTLQKSSDIPSKKISNTMEIDLIAHTGEKLTATPREMIPEETSINASRETEAVPREASTLTLEETAIATSEKTGGVITETDISKEETSAITSGEPSTDASGEANIDIFGKIVRSYPTGSSPSPEEMGDVSPRESYVFATFRETTDNSKDAHEHSFSASEDLCVDTAKETVVVQPGNITGAITKETSTGIDEANTVILRKPSTKVSSKSPPTVTSGASFAITPSEILSTTSPGASAVFANVPKGNVPAATTSKKSLMTNPRGITSASQEKNGTIKPVVLPSYWSIMLTGIMVTLMLAAGLCLIIYYITFYILVTYSTS